MSTRGLRNRNTIGTAESRALLLPYTDPLILNYKLLIDWNLNHGLFADEKYTNSALAYLKRIGEEGRYQMLKNFINQFKVFIQDYDFLMLNVDGIAEVINCKPGTYPVNDDDWKLSFVVRETIDFRLQSLLTLYRHIWFDNQRGVEVLPNNLRRFNCSVLVYSSGYFLELYDSDGILPTIQKVQSISHQTDTYDFSYIMVKCAQCMINNDESGKGLFGEISNEMGSDFAKNSLVFNYRFSSYTGMFKNITGETDIDKTMVVLSAINKHSNQSKYLDKMRKLGKEIVPELKGVGKSLLNRGINIIQQSAKNIIGSQSVIGSYFDTFTDAKKIGNLLGSFGTQLLDDTARTYLTDKSTAVANMMLNFNREINEKITSITIEDNDVQRGVEYQEPIAVITSNNESTHKGVEFQDRISF